MIRQIIVLSVAVLPVLSCGKDAVAPLPKSVGVYNFLTGTIHISAGTTNYGSLGSNNNTVVTVPSETTVLSVTLDPARFSDGSPIASDLSAFTTPITVAGEVDVSNVQGGGTYFNPWIGNSSGVRVEVGITDGGAVRCLAYLDPGGLFSAQLGYYRLTATTTMQVYRAGSTCTGPSRQWTTAQLQNFAAKSGKLFLSVDVAP